MLLVETILLFVSGVPGSLFVIMCVGDLKLASMSLRLDLLLVVFRLSLSSRPIYVKAAPKSFFTLLRMLLALEATLSIPSNHLDFSQELLLYRLRLLNLLPDI